MAIMLQKKFLMVFEKFAPSQKFRTEDFSKTVADALFSFYFLSGKKFSAKKSGFLQKPVLAARISFRENY